MLDAGICAAKLPLLHHLCRNSGVIAVQVIISLIKKGHRMANIEKELLRLSFMPRGNDNSDCEVRKSVLV
jgi:hypothetical protein